MTFFFRLSISLLTAVLLLPTPVLVRAQECAVDHCVPVTAGTLYSLPNTNEFGHPIHSADVNDDNIADMIVSEGNYYLEADHVSSTPRKVHIYFGPTYTQHYTLQAPDSKSLFGNVVKTADLNGDGHTDVVVSSASPIPFGGDTPAGLLAVYYGPLKQNAQPDAIIRTTGAQKISEGQLEITDLNNDRRPEILVGTWEWFPRSQQSNYAVQIICGGAQLQGKKTLDSVSCSQMAYRQPGSSAVILDITTGEYTGDAFNDVIVSTSNGVIVARGEQQLKKTYLFQKKDVTIDTFWISEDGGTGGNRMLDTLNTADLTGDGKDDLIATTYDRERTELSVVVVIPGGLTQAIHIDDAIQYTIAQPVEEGVPAFWNMGFAHSVIDWNSDGKLDLVVGAPEYKQHQGMVALFDDFQEEHLTTDDAAVHFYGDASEPTQFGFAVSAVGDSLAMSAPFTGPTDTGAVWMFSQ